MDDLPPDPPDDLQPSFDDELPLSRPGPGRRGLRLAITLLIVASLVAVFGFNLTAFNRSSRPAAIDSGRGQTVPPTAEPSTSQRLVMVDTGGGLRSMDADGGNEIAYAAGGARFSFPAWSPDGTRIAAIATSQGATGVDVFEATPGGASTATVVYRSSDEPPFYLYWAPDGGRVAFLTQGPVDIGLRQVPADGSGTDVTVRDGSPMYWQWIDGSRMLVHSGGNASDPFVGEVNLDGDTSRPASNQAGLFRAPAVSMSGTYRAYGSGTSSGAASVVVESGGATKLREIPVFGTAALEFDPAGDTLAFVAAASADAVADLPVGPLRLVDPATGADRTLLGGAVVAFFWAPDGRTIAALRLGTPGDTPVVARPEWVSQPVGRLTRAGSPLGPAAFGTAGEQTVGIQTAAGVLLDLVFVDVQAGTLLSERTVHPSDLFLSQVLPFYDQYALSHRFWSPDGRSIVLPLDDDQGISHVAIVAADGSSVRDVGAGAIGFWSP